MHGVGEALDGKQSTELLRNEKEHLIFQAYLWFHIVPMVVPRVVQIIQIFRAIVVNSSHVVLVQLVQHICSQWRWCLLLGCLLTVY